MVIALRSSSSTAIKGISFDGCLHYLFGCGPGQPFYPLWQELGAIQGRQFVHHNELMRLTGPQGETLIVYSDPDRLEAHLTEISPSDQRLIRAFCNGVRAFSDFDLSLLQRQPKALMTPVDWAHLGMKVLPFLRPMARWGLLSAKEFAHRFKDPFLRRAIPQMFAWQRIYGRAIYAAAEIQESEIRMGAS